MSRIGNAPVVIPSGVQAKVQGSVFTVSGPKGELSRSFHPLVSVEVKDGIIHVRRTSEKNKVKALHGLTRSLCMNMVQGVHQGFQKTLEIQGVGYRAQLEGNKLVLFLGYSRPVTYLPPNGVQIEISGQQVTVRGADKELVGQTAAKVRSFRSVEPYKGKGIRYLGEYVRRKAGKAGKVGAGAAK